MPPEALTAPLAAHIVPGEELAEDAAVGQAPDAIALRGDFGHFESPCPRALIPIADIDLRARGKRGPRVRLECPPPSAHAPIVLMPATRP